ncbi:MAG TPA: NAD-dependent epimerase/dehydratase family protein [Trebonia sp.]
MSEFAAIIEAMRRTVPPGRARLGDTDVSALRDLTAALMSARPEAVSEYQRFLAVADRGLCLPEEQVTAKLRDATVLITGGTGCIGSALMRQIAARRPARLVSVSRGVTQAAVPQDGAEYLTVDVTDRGAIERVVADVKPDIVFHLAAQRSPGLAETEVRRTASTNVLGVRNILAAASGAGARQVVLASTGKALRPYSPEVYTASKRAAEWIGVAAAANGEVTCSAARFTHVIDNSIIHGRLLDWSRSGVPVGNAPPVATPEGTVGLPRRGMEGEQPGSGRGGTVGPPRGGMGGAEPPMSRGGVGGIAPPEVKAIRLHSADIAFYVQSALESAQLLLIAMLGAVPGEFRVHAIADLGWPVSLLDVALGTLAAAGSLTPVYISGYDPGYEEVPFPGLYDPATAGDVSPLLNAFEAAALTAKPCPMVDTFTMEMVADPAAPKLLAGLESAFDRGLCDAEIRQALDDLSWSLLDATLAAADPAVLARSARLTRLHEKAMSPVHLRVTRAINAHAGNRS